MVKRRLSTIIPPISKMNLVDQLLQNALLENDVQKLSSLYSSLIPLCHFGLPSDVAILHARRLYELAFSIGDLKNIIPLLSLTAELLILGDCSFHLISVMSVLFQLHIDHDHFDEARTILIKLSCRRGDKSVDVKLYTRFIRAQMRQVVDNEVFCPEMIQIYQTALEAFRKKDQHVVHCLRRLAGQYMHFRQYDEAISVLREIGCLYARDAKYHAYIVGNAAMIAGLEDLRRVDVH